MCVRGCVHDPVPSVLSVSIGLLDAGHTGTLPGLGRVPVLSAPWVLFPSIAASSSPALALSLPGQCPGGRTHRCGVATASGNSSQTPLTFLWVLSPVTCFRLCDPLPMGTAPKSISSAPPLAHVELAWSPGDVSPSPATLLSSLPGRGRQRRKASSLPVRVSPTAFRSYVRGPQGSSTGGPSP